MSESREGQERDDKQEQGSGMETEPHTLVEVWEELRGLNARMDALQAAKGANSQSHMPVMDLQALLYRLIEKWLFILTTALACALLMAVAVFFIFTPKYEATSKLYVLSSSDSAVDLSDLQIGSYLTSDYQEVFDTWEVHQQVIDNLGLAYTYEELTDMLTVENPTDTRILRITFRCEDPHEAQDVANEYANVARAYIGKTMKTEEPMIMSEALLPIQPVSPQKMLDIFLGFVLGAFIAVGIVCVQFIQDDKVRTAEEIAKFGDMATLAVVPAHEGDAAVGSERTQRESRGVHR